MNVFGKRSRSWRKPRKRGVSPIIATILLVAITVVLAAVLYVLVSGLTKGGSSTPYSLGITAISGGASGSGANWFDSLALSPTSGLTTSQFGFSVTTPGGGTVANAAAVGGTGCTLTATPTTITYGSTGCNGPTSGYYAVLLSSSNGILAIYVAGAWSYAAGTSTVAVTASYTLEVISSAQLAGTGDSIGVFGTGSSSVSGSGFL